MARPLRYRSHPGSARAGRAQDLAHHHTPVGTGWFSPFRIGLVVLFLVAALVGWAPHRGSAPSYRTASVSTGTVPATLDSVATITPVNQADLNFQCVGQR